MDKTEFTQNSKWKKCVSVTGFKTSYSKYVGAKFHYTINACVVYNGFVLPPMYVVSGQQLNRDVMYKCTIEGRVIYVSQRVFMNYRLFIKCLVHFDNIFPAIVKRTFVLVYDGYSSHYNNNIVEKDIDLSIIFMLLPANANNLIQHFDIAVINPFKTILK